MTGHLRLLVLCVLLAGGGCVSTPPGGLGGGRLQTAQAVSADLYLLPFEAGARCTCVQAGPGPFSHDGTLRYAVDFEMDEGTPVLASRRGRVTAVKEDSDIGGSSKDYSKDGNHVVVQHADGTRAIYLHLRRDGAIVAVGQQVERGQVIAYSGNTGWSAMPHLHFHVDARDPTTRKWKSIPIRFADVKGDGVPGMLTTYESGNVRCQGRATGVPVK